MPPGVVTVVSAGPVAIPAGAVTVQVVLELHDAAPAATVPTLAVVEPGTNPVPVTVTTVPPASGPARGEIWVTVGAL